MGRKLRLPALFLGGNATMAQSLSRTIDRSEHMSTTRATEWEATALDLGWPSTATDPTTSWYHYVAHMQPSNKFLPTFLPFLATSLTHANFVNMLHRCNTILYRHNLPCGYPPNLVLSLDLTPLWVVFSLGFAPFSEFPPQACLHNQPAKVFFGVHRWREIKSSHRGSASAFSLSLSPTPSKTSLMRALQGSSQDPSNLLHFFLCPTSFGWPGGINESAAR